MPQVGSADWRAYYYLQLGRVPQAFLLELVFGEHSDRKLQLNQ